MSGIETIGTGEAPFAAEPSSSEAGTVLPLLLNEILESLPVAVLVIDASQRIRELNLEAGRLFGHAREELLGQSLEKLLPAPVRAAHADWVRSFVAQPSQRAMGANRDLYANRADGSLVPVEIALKPIRAGDELLVIAAIVDITARKALELRGLADKAELERQVRERTLELEHSNREQREMLRCLEAARAELERLTREDPLTGLANRREFDTRLALELGRALRHGQPLCVAMLDLDLFKRVNDDYGHAVGDEVLRQVAKVLRRQCRTVDLPARYGGEEFVIALPNTGLPAARALCERLRVAIQDHAWAAVRPGLAVTISIGVALREPSDTLRMLIDAADQALYEAKRTGRNKVVVQARPRH